MGEIIKIENLIKCISVKGEETKITIDPEKLIFLGDRYGGYVVLKDLINPTSICYSAGVGVNVSFDNDLYNTCVEWHGIPCHHWVMDPTPSSKKVMETWHKKLKMNLTTHILTCGLGGEDGDFKFSHQGPGISWSFEKTTGEGMTSETTKIVPVKKLSTLMKENSHKKINILKMDIEGDEYGIIDDIIENKLDIDMIALEFHGHNPKIGKWGYSKISRNSRNEYIAKLEKYKLSNVWKDKGERDYLFIKNELMGF